MNIKLEREITDSKGPSYYTDLEKMENEGVTATLYQQVVFKLSKNFLRICIINIRTISHKSTFICKWALLIANKLEQ